ncbi:hypothetical protein BU25DRAFT_19388 [Macroventuria anomochaeta]|uniref:Uncharacterized protein n=1 Tax=Macroventuria anomochaeta TaxID=301207 RepID=A0ACB6S7X4_9PLEO|nr:uncharacterized protein BU25DRAFT_19388 [Macroventuria anomochaeta]KAF2629304.1 hypothetical protein BU25DRAFT_19388 [Macroventuria anomochaeta]
MPPKPSSVPAASEQAAAEANLDGLTLNGGDHRDTGEKSAPGEQGAKARRNRNRDKRRRSKKSKDATADNATSTTTDGVTEVDSTSEAEADKSIDLRAPSPLSDTDTIATESLPQFKFGRALSQPFVEVPVLAHYELRELPSAGENEDDDDNDQGLFAFKKIEQGTRIISERPLFTLPAPGDQLHDLMPAYHNLPKSEQERIWNLRPAAPETSEQLQNLRFLTDRLAMDLQNIMFKSEAIRTKEEQATLDEMKPKLENAMNVWRVAARWHANRCSMTDLPVAQRADLPKGTPVTGLFIERAHIRHSCVPNCFASYDPNLDRINVHVTRDIAVGEELTLSAFADNNYYKNAEDRKEELSAWGLTCNCEACDEKHPKFEIHEAARQRAHTRVVLLNDILTRLETEDFPEDNLTTAQEILLALIRDLKASGCETVETVRWRNILVDRILPARALVVPDSEKLIAWQIVLGHARECERMGKICYGGDREECRVLEQTREGTEAAIRMLEEAIANEEAVGGFFDED